MTERLLQANGWLCESTESFNAHSGRSKDFLGFADYIAIGSSVFNAYRVIAIQVTTTHNKSARFKKIVTSINAYLWHMAGGEIWLLTWKLRQKIWEPSLQVLYTDDFPKEYRDKAHQYWSLKVACARRDIEDHKIKTKFITL